MVEAAVLIHQSRQGHLAGVPERRVPQVVRQADALHQVFVGAQGAGDGAGDLRDLQGMRQAGAVIIALVIDEDLRLVLQAAESRGVQDAVAVALESRAVLRLLVGVDAPLGITAAAAVWRQGLLFDGFELVAVE